MTLSIEQADTLNELVKQQLELETEIDGAEDSLKEKKEALRRIQQELLPDYLLNDCGLRDCTLADGMKLEVKQDMSISVPKKNMLEISAWLKDKGHGDIVLDEVSLAFHPDEQETKQQIIDSLKSAGVEYSLANKINSNTLKSILKQELQSGMNPEGLKLFGAYSWKKSIIKR